MNLCMTGAISWPSPVIKGAGAWSAVYFCAACSPASSRVFSRRAFHFSRASLRLNARLPSRPPWSRRAQPSEPEIVSRSVQRGAGLLTAYIVYGAAIGGLFSLVFALAYGRVNGFDPKALSALLALAGFIAMVLVPELKYPASPPAIGVPETIGARTALYFAMLAISLLAMTLAATLAPPFAARLGSWNGALFLPPSSSRWRAWLPWRCRPSMKFQLIFRRASCGIFVWRPSARARSCGLRSG